MNLNTQFIFEGKQKRLLIIGMAVGLLCLLWSLVGDDQFQTRFWTNFLHNTVYFTGIAFTSIFFLAAQITAFAGWNTVIRRVSEAMGQFMLVGLVLVGVIVAGVWGHFIHLYHWNTPGLTDPNNPIYDKVIAGKSGFLNPVFFTVGTLGFLGLWYFWYTKIRRASVEQDTMETEDFKYYKRQQFWSASFLPIAGFLSPVFLWLILMSIDPHWYSTMFSWYSTISMWLGSLAMTILLILTLKSRGYMEYVTREHLHDLGKYLFGISVFWTYLWFDQFMLIWYANVGEETIYYKERMNHYPILYWGNLLINFVAPFLILMRNDTKRKAGTMFFVAALVLFGHWWDFFYMIKPGARIAAYEAMELAEGVHGKHHEGTIAPLSEHKDESHSAPNDPTAHKVEEHGDAESELEPHDQNPTNAGSTEGHPVHGNEPAAAERAGGEGETGAPGGVTTTPEGASGLPTEQGRERGTASAETPNQAVPGAQPLRNWSKPRQSVVEQLYGNDQSAVSAPPTADRPETGLSAPHGPEEHGGEHAADAHGEQGGKEHGPDKSFKMGYTLPGFPELGAMVGFLCLFLYVFYSSLAKFSLVPMRDPYLEESLHHATGAHIDAELEEAAAEGHSHH